MLTKDTLAPDLQLILDSEEVSRFLEVALQFIDLVLCPDIEVKEFMKRGSYLLTELCYLGQKLPDIPEKYSTSVDYQYGTWFGGNPRILEKLGSQNNYDAVEPYRYEEDDSTHPVIIEKKLSTDITNILLDLQYYFSLLYKGTNNTVERSLIAFKGSIGYDLGFHCHHAIEMFQRLKFWVPSAEL